MQICYDAIASQSGLEIDSVEKDLPDPLLINQSNNQYYQPELI